LSLAPNGSTGDTISRKRVPFTVLSHCAVHGVARPTTIRRQPCHRRADAGASAELAADRLWPGERGRSGRNARLQPMPFFPLSSLVHFLARSDDICLSRLATSNCRAHAAFAAAAVPQDARAADGFRMNCFLRLREALAARGRTLPGARRPFPGPAGRAADPCRQRSRRLTDRPAPCIRPSLRRSMRRSSRVDRIPSFWATEPLSSLLTL
jgi:hypothetical protein